MRCVRASERSCAWARWTTILPPLGWANSRSAPALSAFADRCWGFKKFEVILLTGAGVLWVPMGVLLTGAGVLSEFP